MTSTKIDTQAHQSQMLNYLAHLVYHSLSVLNTASLLSQSRYTSLTLRQSTTLQNRFKYSSLPQTPKPALIHACSWTLMHMSGLRSSPALRRSLAVPSSLLEFTPPTRSLDVTFHCGRGGASGSSNSASSGSAPGEYCDEGVSRSPADVELFFFESGSSGWCHASGVCENWTFDDDGEDCMERRWVRFKGWGASNEVENLRCCCRGWVRGTRCAAPEVGLVGGGSIPPIA